MRIPVTFITLLFTSSLAFLTGFDETPIQNDVKKLEVPDVPDASGKRPDLAAAAKLIVSQTNALRKKEGLGSVTTAAKLVDTAKYFADYMARNDEYGHEADGNTLGDRVKRHGYEYCLVSENIAYSFNSGGFDTEPLAEQFATGWEKSPPHRKNMLDPDATAIGVAIARSEKTGYYYAVQLFARPMSDSIVFKVQNQAGEDVSYALGDQKFALPPRTIRTHTLCRPAELTFNWPGGKAATAKPSGGDLLVVTKGESGFEVKKQ
jgi:uncharacterized protein YkwD